MNYIKFPHRHYADQWNLPRVRPVRLDLRGGDDRFVSSGLDRLVGGGIDARSIKYFTNGPRNYIVDND